MVHLTMCGSNLPDVIDEIRECENILVAVGAEKVPAEMYDLAGMWPWATSPIPRVAALVVPGSRLFMGSGALRCI